MFRLVGIDSRLPFDNLSRDPECLLCEGVQDESAIRDLAG
jgi:hypothetical protein